MAKKNIKLSASRIQSYLSCKQKYWFNYIKKLPKVSNPSFKLGLAVHESLEYAGAIWLEKGEFSKEDTEKIMEVYNTVSIREGIEDYAIHLEGKDLVKKRLAEFMSGQKIIGLETKFGFFGDAPGPQISSKYGVPLMGAIDKIEEYDEDTLLIIDYKTSKTAPTGDQLRTDIQLSLYDIVARQLYPEYKRVILALDMLKAEPVYTYRTPEQREEFEQYLKVVYDEMLNLKEEDVSATLDMFCPWCSYKDYCSAYKKACEKSDYNFLPTVQYSDDRLIQEWEDIKSTKKILENRERELSMILSEKIKHGPGNIKTQEKEVYIRQNSRVEYDINELKNVIPPMDLIELVNPNKKAIEAYMDLNPSLKDKIQTAARSSFTSPFLATRKVK